MGFMASLMFFGKTKQGVEVEERGGGQHYYPGSGEQASRLGQLQGQRAFVGFGIPLEDVRYLHLHHQSQPSSKHPQRGCSTQLCHLRRYFKQVMLFIFSEEE